MDSKDRCAWRRAGKDRRVERKREEERKVGSSDGGWRREVWRNRTHLAHVTSEVEECKVEGERVKNKQRKKHHEGGEQKGENSVYGSQELRYQALRSCFELWNLIQRLAGWLTMASKHSSHAAQTCRVSLRQRDDASGHWSKCIPEPRHQVKTAASVRSQALGQWCYLHVRAEFRAFLRCHYFWTSPWWECIPDIKPIYLLELHKRQYLLKTAPMQKLWKVLLFYVHF